MCACDNAMGVNATPRGADVEDAAWPIELAELSIEATMSKLLLLLLLSLLLLILPLLLLLLLLLLLPVLFNGSGGDFELLLTEPV